MNYKPKRNFGSKNKQKTFNTKKYSDDSENEETYLERKTSRNHSPNNFNRNKNFEKKSSKNERFVRSDKNEESKSWQPKNKSSKSFSDTRDSKKRFNNKRDYKKSYNNQKSSNSKDEYKNFDWPIRLNRYISNAGICGRRDADKLIEEGLITVNGKVVTELGTKVERRDVVTYKGNKILPEKPVYLLMNKPKNYITTTKDESNRQTIMDLISDEIEVRVYPVGRLDRKTTGVLLLTNDGELAQKLTHPSFEIKKIYEVTLEKNVTMAELEQLAKGVELEDGLAFADAISYTEPSNKKVIGIEIHSGKNRIVRRMFEHLGHNVEKLDRVMFGPFTKKGVERGKYRYLKNSEIAQLKRSKKKL